VSGGYPPWLVGAKTGLFVGSPQEPIVRRKKLRGDPPAHAEGGGVGGPVPEGVPPIGE